MNVYYWTLIWSIVRAKWQFGLRHSVVHETQCIVACGLRFCVMCLFLSFLEILEWLAILFTKIHVDFWKFFDIRYYLIGLNLKLFLSSVYTMTSNGQNSLNENSDQLISFQFCVQTSPLVCNWLDLQLIFINVLFCKNFCKIVNLFRRKNLVDLLDGSNRIIFKAKLSLELKRNKVLRKTQLLDSS